MNHDNANCLDYIKREDAINVFDWGMPDADVKCGIAIQNIKDIPSSDVVEVVRCKDCIHNHITSWNQGKRDNPWCHFTDLVRSNEFYCGFGERADT